MIVGRQPIFIEELGSCICADADVMATATLSECLHYQKKGGMISSASSPCVMCVM
jgi:hypothetical protein